MNANDDSRTAQNSTRRTFLKGIGVATVAAYGIGSTTGVTAASSRSNYTIRSGTDEETEVYVVTGSRSGPTVVVIGGVHGNEASGWRAAEEIKEWDIDAGKLVVLPRANVPAINAGHRPWGTWDLNRHFPSGERPKSRLAQAIWDDVIVEHDPDFVWDLHSSQGIHSEGDGVGQAIFPTRAGDARSQASDIRSFLNDEYVPDSMPTYEFTGSSSVDGTQDMLKHKVGADLGVPSIIFETVHNDLSMARQIAWTTAAVWRFLQNYELITRIERTVTITGKGETAHYEFAVDGAVTKSASYGAGINGFDEFDGNTVTGRTTNQPDSFRFTGSITDFDADAPVDVAIDGSDVGSNALDRDVLTIVGDGGTAHYEFTVDGSVSKSTANGGTINEYDRIHDDGSVTGRTTNEPDSFSIDGSIQSFKADAPVNVYLNGEEVDPTSLSGNVLTIVGDGGTAHYEFAVDGFVEKSTDHGGTINSFDRIHDDGTVTGRTTSEPDSFAFTGSITDFDADNDVTVSLNGNAIHPELLGASTITIDGNETTAYYEFTVDGPVEKSTAYGGTINGYDQIYDDGRVTGRTTNEPDSFACTGIITSFEIDGSATVYADGEAVELR